MLGKLTKLFFKEDQPQHTVATRSTSAAGGMGLLGFPAGSRYGANVSKNTALCFSTVYAAVNIISNDLATLPVMVMQDTADGQIRKTQHKQNYLLKKKPNPLYNAISYKRTLFANYLLWGNGYAKIHRDGLGDPVKYEIWQPWKVDVFAVEGELFYKNYETGEILHSSDIIHIADLSHDGLKGLSKIALASQSISLGMSAIDFGNKFYDKGASMSGYLKMKKKMTDPNALSKLRTDFMAQYAGRDNAGTVGILEEDTEFVPYKYAMPMSDAQVLESRKFQVEEVLRFFGLPPHKVGHLEKSSFNNIEQQNTEYVVNTLTPTARLFEIEHDTKIFSDEDAIDHFIKIELKGLLRGDIKARTELYTKMIDRGVFSPNEVRQLEDLPKYEGGDVRMLPLNFTPVENFGKHTDGKNNNE